MNDDFEVYSEEIKLDIVCFAGCRCGGSGECGGSGSGGCRCGGSGACGGGGT